MDTLHEEINAFCEQYFPDVLPLPLYEHRRQLGMIVAVSRLPKAYSIEQFSRLLQQKLQQCHKGAIHVYVGEQVAKLSDLRQAYITAKDATMYKYLDPTQVIFVYDQLKSIALRYTLMETQYYHQLSEAIEEQQEEKLLETVEHVFRHFSENRYVPEAVRTSLHRCASNALEMLGRMEVDIKKMVYHDSMTTWYDRNLTISTLKQLFTAFVKECSQLSLSKRMELSKGRIQKIKNYIDENYATKINLKSVAARFYMSPVYLGQLFRKTYGIYFIDYVLQLRVAEAKRLLRQTDMRVYEIAERVGFNNTEYFVSQFEKMEEMTPTEYRTRLIK
jgi:two-component system response regulator YesN